MSEQENPFEYLFKIAIKTLDDVNIPYVIPEGAILPYYGNIRTISIN